MRPTATLLGLAVAVAFGPGAQPDFKKFLKKEIPIADYWIYDDLPKAFAEGKATGKPILALFR